MRRETRVSRKLKNKIFFLLFLPFLFFLSFCCSKKKNQEGQKRDIQREEAAKKSKNKGSAELRGSGHVAERPKSTQESELFPHSLFSNLLSRSPRRDGRPPSLRPPAPPLLDRACSRTKTLLTPEASHFRRQRNTLENSKEPSWHPSDALSFLTSAHHSSHPLSTTTHDVRRRRPPVSRGQRRCRRVR